MPKKAHFPLEIEFEEIQHKGLEKIVQMMKLVLREASRLQAALFSKDLSIQETASAEVNWILTKLSQEASKEGYGTEEVFWKKLEQTHAFTPTEWEQLKFYTQLLKQNSERLRPKSHKKSRIEFQRFKV